MPLSIAQLDASPRDLQEISGGTDIRTLDKLINGVNVTMDDVNMWLIPFTQGSDHVLTVDLGSRVSLSGVRVWNYNKSEEDTFRGARVVHITIDGHSISPVEGFALRKAPGHANFDFGQFISFDERTQLEQPADSTRALNLDHKIPGYVMPLNVSCMHLHFKLLATCGDPHFIGLTALELFGARGETILLSPSQLAAFPSRQVFDFG